MERNQGSNLPSRIERQLSHLKILSRLLGHELHAQTSTRITLSRDEVTEMQTSLDLFIEGVLQSRRGVSAPSAPAPAQVDVQPVNPRIN